MDFEKIEYSQKIWLKDTITGPKMSNIFPIFLFPFLFYYNYPFPHIFQC